MSVDVPDEDSHLSDDQVQQLVDWDAALAQGADLPHPKASSSIDDPRLARQIRCMQMLRQTRNKPGSIRAHGMHLTPRAEDSNPAEQSAAQRVPNIPPLDTTPPGFAAQVFPATLGKFELREELGRGGYGVVFLAHDRALGREVALKVPHANVLMRDELLMRFRIEARAAGVLDHPNIVQVYDAGTIGPVSYIASAYCPGTSLHDWLERHASEVKPRDAAELVMCLARAIQHANERGVFHRDLKPANILLQPTSGLTPFADEDDLKRHTRMTEFARQSPLSQLTPRITDFGLAKLTDETLATVSGSILGTPAYMAPEQASGQSRTSTSRVDVYSLGAILYQLLAGTVPFEGPSPWETLRRVMHETPASIRTLRTGVARDLETICLKCLEKEPQQRYASAAELADDLQRFLNHEPILARSTSTWEQLIRLCRRKPLASSLAAALVLAVCLGLVTVLYLWKQSEARRLRIEEALIETAQASQLAQQQQKTSQRLLYLNSVSLAEKESEVNLAHARDQLNHCDSQLRDWEWDYLWKKCHPELLDLAGHKQSARVCRFSPDGKLVASGSGGWGIPLPGEILVRETRTGKTVWELGKHLGQITGLSFHPTKNLLASSDNSWRGDQPGCTQVWDLNNGQLVTKLRLSRSTHDVQFDPRGRFLATAGNDGRVRLFRTENWRLSRTLWHHQRSVLAISFHPSGELIASAGRDGRLCVSECDTGKLVYEQDDLTDVRCVAFSPDGSLLACSTFGGHVLIWQTQGWNLISRRWASTGRVGSLEFSPDGQCLLVSTISGATQVWDVRSGHIRRSIPTHYPSTLHATFNAEGNLIATCGSDSHLKIWSTATPNQPRMYRVTDSYIRDVAVIPGTDWIACGVSRNTSTIGAGDGDYAIRIVDRASGKVARLLKGHTSWTNCLDHSPNDRTLVSASLDGEIRLWDLETGQTLKTINAHEGLVTGVAFVSENHVISSGSDAQIQLWDIREGQLVRQIASGDSPYACLASARSVGWVAAGDESGTIHVWNWRQPELHYRCEGLQSVAKCLAFNDDGSQLAAGGQAHEICLWELPSTPASSKNGQPPASLVPRLTCRSTIREVQDIMFLPSGNRLAYTSTNFSGSATVRIIDSVTGEEALHLIDRDEAAAAIAFHPGQQELILAINSSLLIHSTALPDLAERWQIHDQETKNWRAREAGLAEQQSNAFALATQLSPIIADDPENTDLLFRRANAYAGLQKWELAEQDFARMAELSGESPDTHFNRAMLDLAKGDSDGFQRTCDSMIALYRSGKDPAHANTIAWTLCLTPHRATDRDLAIELAQHACDHAKSATMQHLSYNTLALALYRSEKYDQALKAIRRSIELKNNMAYDADSLVLAMVQHARGEHDESRLCLEKAEYSLEKAVHLGSPVSKTYSRNWINRFQMLLLLREVQQLHQTPPHPQ